MKILNGILYLEFKDLTSVGVSEKYIRRAKSGNVLCWNFIKDIDDARCVLIEYETLKPKYKQLIIAEYGNPYTYMANSFLNAELLLKPQDEQFLDHYTTEDGTHIRQDLLLQYKEACKYLDLIERITTKKAKKLGFPTKQHFNQAVLQLIIANNIKLPNTYQTLQRKLQAYKQQGAECLTGKLGNSNSSKVQPHLQQLLNAIYASGKCYINDVHKAYTQFIAGNLQLVNHKTGELFNKDDFDTIISVKTIERHLKLPASISTTAKKRTGNLEYRSTHRPHAHRSKPNYSFSKISMDDISLPYKLHNGERIWSYQIFDVASGAVIGYSFGKDKNKELFKAAIANMMALIVKNKYGMPAEIEVEQHISNTFKGDESIKEMDLLTDGHIFNSVRWCLGGNPQEKNAENTIKAKKYAHQAKKEGFAFRPFTKLEANRANASKTLKSYDYDEIVELELQNIAEYNNELHPNQTKYKGFSRLQVLKNNINKNLSTPQMHAILPLIGKKTSTTIVRNAYCSVKNNKYHLPNPHILKALKNYSVDAWWLMNDFGDIKEVYIYQNEKFICKCDKVKPFQQAQIERTDADYEALAEQQKYIKAYDKMVKDGVNDLAQIEQIKTTQLQNILQQTQSVATKAVDTEPVEEDQEQVHYAWMNNSYLKRKALGDI